MIPVYGFGAQVSAAPKGAEMNMHCFPVNLNIEKAEVHRVAGIMQAYQRCLATVGLSGPTLFNDIIAKYHLT